MTTFLFWNLNKQPLQHLVAALAHEHSVDVIILAECTIAYSTLVTALNENRLAKYSLTYSPSERVLIYTRLPHNSITPVRDEGGVSIRKLVPPVGVEVTLVAVHLSSKLHQESDEQALTGTRIARLIEEVEREAAHTRTIVVGDLNMNPFEAGVVGAEALHAVMNRRVAEKGSRIVEGMQKRFFYNPMWGRFGDTEPGPPGTYYYSTSTQINFFWNMFDQVLIRPELLDKFREEDLSVLTKAGSTLLLSENGVPDKTLASDHLPILFSQTL